MPNFLLVDDHSVVREGIKLIIKQHLWFVGSKKWTRQGIRAVSW